MKRRTRIEATLETRRLVIRWSTSLAPTWCAGCASHVRWITPEEAAALAGVSMRTLYRRVERRRYHWVETDLGVLLICPNSLLIQSN